MYAVGGSGDACKRPNHTKEYYQRCRNAGSEIERLKESGVIREECR